MFVFNQKVICFGVLLFAIFFSGCHKNISQNSALWDSHSATAQRRRLVSDAHQLKRYTHFKFNNAKFSYDCSGYIASALYKNGLYTQDFAQVLQVKGNGVRILYEFIEKNGLVQKDPHLPLPGDIIFFSNTYDRNKDGKLNDELTHIAMVESVDTDGQVVFLHHLRGKVQTGFLNMGYERLHKKDDDTINSYLRRKRSVDIKNTPYLASAMVYAYGSLILK